MFKSFGMGVLLLATVSNAVADPRDYQDGSYRHTMHAGERLQIANARSWGPPPECASTGAKVVPTQRPAHGTLTMDRVTTVVPADHGDCAGHRVATERVFYKPSRNYQGEDYIAYNEIFGNGGTDRHVDEHIDVEQP